MRRNSGSAVSPRVAGMPPRPAAAMRKLFREVGEPLVLAHVIRHLGDVYHEQGCSELAEPCYHEALGLYRSHDGGSSLDLANAIRSFAVLRWEQTKALWEDVRDLYTNLSVEAGVKENSARVAALSIR